MIARVQYNATLAITGAIKGTSQQKIYNELGFESLRFREDGFDVSHSCYGWKWYFLAKKH